jgi:hypothetical protein
MRIFVDARNVVGDKDLLVVVKMCTDIDDGGATL